MHSSYERAPSRVAIVTGASTPRGIGDEIAKRFARGNTSLLLVADATRERFDQTASACRELGAERLEFLLSDLGESSARRAHGRAC